MNEPERFWIVRRARRAGGQWMVKDDLTGKAVVAGTGIRAEAVKLARKLNREPAETP